MNEAINLLSLAAIFGLVWIVLRYWWYDDDFDGMA